MVKISKGKFWFVLFIVIFCLVGCNSKNNQLQVFNVQMNSLENQNIELKKQLEVLGNNNKELSNKIISLKEENVLVLNDNKETIDQLNDEINKLKSCNNVTEKQLPLEEAEIIDLMNEKMDIEDIQDWNMVKNGEIFTFSYVPKDTLAEGISYSVNSKTGTVYENISGAPQTNLAVKDCLNFKDITNGNIYYSEIYKLANPLIESNNLLPIPSNDNWIEGGYSDGYLYGEVKNGDREFSVKFDVFTKEWEEIENSF